MLKIPFKTSYHGPGGGFDSPRSGTHGDLMLRDLRRLRLGMHIKARPVDSIVQ
jgi:hypothetical protein